MIDFISLELPLHSIEGLLNSPLLNLSIRVNEVTGEEIQKNKFTKTIEGEYKNLKIEIISNLQTNKTRVVLRGSVHKFLMNGINCNDFDFNALETALNSLKELLNIELNEIIIHSIEFGVNIRIPYSCKSVLNDLLFYINETPTTEKYYGKGQMIKFNMTQYIVKVYNKGLQYFENGHFKTYSDNLLRFEIHVDKMQYLHKKGIHLRTLADVLNTSYLQNLGTILKNTFIDLVLYDSRVNLSQLSKKDRLFLIETDNSKYWDRLRKSNTNKQYPRALAKFKRLIRMNTANDLQSNLVNLISNKWNELLNNVPKLPSSDNMELSECYTLILGNKETIQNRYCLVTGIDISHQKCNSEFLSEWSIGLIQYSDIELYNRLNSKYGPMDKHSRINYHIAHNVRNEYFNRIHNFKKRILRTIEQTTLFNINEVLTLTESQRNLLQSFNSYK